eukprot:maker-scaffold237_size242172-snap-gene-0.16 protein:Tk05163 transcript:maker-scaffold237_size242172-snap-gene-0.16-mRNA-1 annotation:"PREDICTED: hemocytin"
MCNPPCQSGGICMAPNQCHCPDNFEGPLCEVEKAKPCLSRPPSPRGARVYCNQTSCQINCMPHHEFPNGAKEARMTCINGDWVVAGTESGRIDNCNPTCDPPCENGGFCLSYNQCQCPEDYKGLQCQHRASNCQPELMEFNGGYNCTGTQTTFTCVVYCPNGIDFEHAPAPLYTCDYGTGTFEPMPVPDCDYGQGVQVIRTKKTVKKRFRTHVRQSGSSLNWTWVLEGNAMKHRWQSSLGQTWILDHGMHAQGESQGQESQEDSIYNEEGKINLAMLKRYRRNVQAGGWWFGWGMSQQNFPTLEGSENEELMMILSRHQSARPGSCLFWSQTHLKNLDGTTLSFPLDANCPITLLREEHDGTFEVQAEKHCQSSNGGGYGGSQDSVCTLKIVVMIEDQLYELAQGIDGSVITRSGQELAVPGSYSGVVLEKVGQWLFMHVDGLGFHIKWDAQDTIILDVGESLWNKTSGMCGTHNGNPYDDFADKSGQPVQQLAHLLTSWQASHECDRSDRNNPITSCSSPADEELAKTFCAKLIDLENLAECRKVLNPLPFFEACKVDHCQSSSPTGMCHSISSYVIQCQTLGVDINANGGWRGPDFCPLECSKDRIYFPCGSGESDSCDSVNVEDNHLHESGSEGICIEGCYCPHGMFYRDGTCIPKRECPCQFNSQDYEPGQEIKSDCNTCICRDGTWQCSEKVCGRRCSVVGDPHYTTFDGKKFDFMGQCSYHLVKASNFSIEVENVACSGSVSESMNYPKSTLSMFPSCTKSVTLHLGGKSIKLKQNLEVLVDGVEVRVPMAVKTLLGQVLISRASSLFQRVILPNSIQIWWDGYARLHVDAPGEFKDTNQLGGLCGNFNGQQKDDFTTPEGDIEQDPILFANRWRSDETCDASDGDIHHPCTSNPDRKSQAEALCSKLTGSVFSDCHGLVDPTPFYQDCVFDLCACEHEPKECLCPTLSFYAQSCSDKGKPLQWREEVHECGISCQMGQEFQACGSSCGLTCLDMSLQGNQTCADVCVEGCQCPQGQKLDHLGQCVSIQTCPCVDSQGEIYAPNSMRYQPDQIGNEICVCGHAQWDCRGATEEEKGIMQQQAKIVCNASNHEQLEQCPKGLEESCQVGH